MQLVQHVHQVYLVRQLNLILNDVAELIVKLLGEVGVALVVDDVLNASVRHQLRFAFRLVLTNVLFPLLINGLLV